MKRKQNNWSASTESAVIALLIWTLLLLFSALHGQNQPLPHISQSFVIENVWDFPPCKDIVAADKMVTCLTDSLLFFVTNTVPIPKDTAAYLSIHFLNWRTGINEEYRLTIPRKKMKHNVFAHSSTYWLRALVVSQNKMALLADDAIWFYGNVRGQWHLLQQIACEDVLTGYYHGDSFYGIQEVEHAKLLLLRWDTLHYDRHLIREFPLQSPFVKQFTPNRYFDIENDGFYILSTNQLTYTKFSLSGDSLCNVKASVADWKEIPAELNAQIMRYPYGVERIYQALEHNRQNSYATQIFAFDNDKALLGYHHYDTLQQYENFRLCWVERRQDSVQVTPVRFVLDNQEIYMDDIFPFYYYHSALVAAESKGNYWVEIVKDSPVAYGGKTQKEYTDSVNAYFVRHDPQWKVRVLRLRERETIRRLSDSLQLWDENGNRIYLSELQTKRAVVFFNNDVQCMGCRRYLLNFLGQNLKNKPIELMIIFSDVQDYLARREEMKKVSQETGISYTPLFVKMGQVRGSEFYKPYTYPKIILLNLEKDSWHYYDSTQLFSDETVHYQLTNEFLQNFEKFLQE